jgi:hypothetical protein
MEDGGVDDAQPTLWIAASVVLALAAIGLGIWGFGQKSDLDDANDTISQQKAQLAGQESSAATKQKAQAVFDAKTVAKYRAIRSRLLAEDTKEGESQKQIEKEASDLKQAKGEVASADTADQKAKAQLNKATQETQLAAACARGTIDAINSFFSSNNAARGAQRSMNKLDALEPQCEDVLHAGGT